MGSQHLLSEDSEQWDRFLFVESGRLFADMLSLDWLESLVDGDLACMLAFPLASLYCSTAFMSNSMI